MSFPKIIHKDKEYYQVGCKNCRKGDDWNIYSDGKDFVARCKCGNTILMSEVILQNRPDPKPIPLHQLI